MKSSPAIEYAKRNHRRAAFGHSLIEVLAALALASILMVSVLQLLKNSSIVRSIFIPHGRVDCSSFWNAIFVTVDAFASARGCSSWKVIAAPIFFEDSRT